MDIRFPGITAFRVFEGPVPRGFPKTTFDREPVLAG